MAQPNRYQENGPRHTRAGNQPSSATSRPISIPPKASLLAGWSLLPLRIFIGVTFLFAGLQKLANPNFLNANSPSSIQAQLIASARISPIHLLIGHLIRFAVPMGIVISLGEIAVGIGMLLGLWTRLAAIGGALLAFMLFLTVSFHASPYYTGADIVFFFAFFPFIISGTGGVWSLDARIRRRAFLEEGQGDPSPYVLAFEQLRAVCMNFDNGACTAQRKRPCGPVGCPVLLGGHESIVTRGGRPNEVDRRTVVIGSSAAVAAGVAGVVIAGATAGLGRAIGGSPLAKSSTNGLGSTTTPSTSTTTPAGGSTTTSAPHPAGTALGKASVVPVAGAATFTSANGDPGVVIQPASGQFVAYNAICPHAGCTVQYSQAASLLVCPCHGSEFKVNNGDVINGPAPTGLKPYKIAEGPNGILYIQT